MGECEHGPEDDDLCPNKGCLAVCGKDGKCWYDVRTTNANKDFCVLSAG
jgi:hypothetical protein